MYPDHGLWDDGLERAMRTMSLKRDPNAPTAPAPEDLLNIELRQDVSDFRERLKKAKAANRDRKTWNALAMRVHNLVQYLSNLAVRVRRKEYFERVDQLRALGQSTLEEAAPVLVNNKPYVRLSRGGKALNKVTRFLQQSSYSTGEGTKAKSYIQQ
jgi:hypothetical protein